MYDFGNSKSGKELLVEEMAKHTFAMRHSWYRSMLHSLKGKQSAKIHDNVHKINFKKKSRTVALRGAMGGAAPKQQYPISRFVKEPIFPKPNYKKQVSDKKEYKKMAVEWPEEMDTEGNYASYEEKS
eukprot:Phypoly_transcript_28668.p1 GENE.Phypoly_transcript_28668~~Phypoly_transcript_28668.p1  ORF type:complete len:127 (+),score=32.29 Phypoly_transcript_28668:2-382(+)